MDLRETALGIRQVEGQRPSWVQDVPRIEVAFERAHDVELVTPNLSLEPGRGHLSDAVVVGDKRPYLSCLVMIDQENVEHYAQTRSVPFTDYRSLCARPEIVELVDSEVNRVNEGFSSVEQVKKFRLIDVLLTAEDEELTPTMKLKRSFVSEKYADLIASMYTRSA